MTPRRQEQIAGTLTQLIEIKSWIADIAMDIDCLHDEERFTDHGDPYSPAAEEALHEVWNLVSPAEEALEEAIAMLKAILPGRIVAVEDADDAATAIFRELA